MTWTLWRGSELMGKVVRRPTSFGQPGQVSGVLLLHPGGAAPKGASQHRITIPGQSWVVELPQPDLDAMERSSTSRSTRPLKPHPPGTPLGIPPEEQLSIRDAADELVPVGAVSVYEHRIHPEQPAEEVAALPDGAVVDGSVWLVSFRSA